ncbi:MAG: OsmC family protein [Gemmatimonadota bacterium]|nr:OsmC family protein [Gemmatimonadota bacterium]
MSTTMTRTRLNGVDVPALIETIEAIKADPSLGESHWRNHNRWYEGGLNRSEIQGFYAAGQEDDSRKAPFVFDNDEPPVLLGQNRGPNPVEYILHALAGCVTTTMVYYAAVMGIELTKVETEFEGDIDLRGLLGVSDEVDPGYEQIRIDVRIEGDATPDQLDELVEIAKAHSPVFDTVRRPVDIQVRRVA